MIHDQGISLRMGGKVLRVRHPRSAVWKGVVDVGLRRVIADAELLQSKAGVLTARYALADARKA